MTARCFPPRSAICCRTRSSSRSAITEVALSAYASGDRVLIDVADHCGGLPAGDAERMFHSLTHHSADRSGLGLGLSISHRSIEANDGVLRVRDVPGTGCVFTIDLPSSATSPSRPAPRSGTDR